MPRRRTAPSFPAVLVTVLLLVGCDQQNAESFSVEGWVDTPQGEPVQGASVGVRPCYDIGGEVACSADALLQQARSSSGPASVELVASRAQRDGSDAGLAWRTASETTNERFEIERKIEDESLQFVVTTPDGAQTYRRTITDGKNAFALAVSPCVAEGCSLS